MSDVTAPKKGLLAMKDVNILQCEGKDCFIAKLDKRAEVKTVAGIILPESAQDYPRTGTVVKVSNVMSFDEATKRDIYPGVQVGRCVLVKFNAWNSTFEIGGDTYGTANAANVIATYDAKDVCQEQ